MRMSVPANSKCRARSWRQQARRHKVWYLTSRRKAVRRWVGSARPTRSLTGKTFWRTADRSLGSTEGALRTGPAAARVRHFAPASMRLVAAERLKDVPEEAVSRERAGLIVARKAKPERR